MVSKNRVISVFMLAMINVAAICNIANLPIPAKYGFASLFFYIVVSLFFFLPVSLISAELATAWPQSGGVYIWVKEALGDRLGFLAVWLQWAENIIWYPTALSFTAATFAYTFNPSLAHNPIYIMVSVLVIFWVVTFVNLLGMKTSSWISTLCVIIGTLIPATLIIVLGVLWVVLKHPAQISFTLSNFLPDISSFTEWTYLAGIVLTFGGMEMSAVHAKEVKNPQKNYPKAILLSSLIIFSILSLGALSIAILVPQENIRFASGTIEALSGFLSAYGLHWTIPVMAGFMTFGALGMISTWSVGPIKGILATAQHGELPPYFQKVNKKNMPIRLMFFQAIIVTVLSLVFLYMPSVSASYWILYCLTAQLYLIMYILLFISAIVLRYKKPNIKRPFRVPFGKVGIWGFGLLGAFVSLFAIIMGFFPPGEEKLSVDIFYVSFLFFSVFIFCIIPFIIHRYKKENWKQKIKINNN